MPKYNSFLERLVLVILLVLDSTQYAEGLFDKFGSSILSTTCSASPSYEYDIQDQFDYTCNPDDGTYALSVSWIHDAALSETITCSFAPPFAPPTRCYQDFEPDIIAATGLFGVSIEYNCGHPPSGFLTPHYDVYFYRFPVTVREQWTCQTSGMASCDTTAGAQTTPAGRGFHNVNYVQVDHETESSTYYQVTPANMPNNFVCHAGIPHVGLHCDDFSTHVDTPDEWIKPDWIMGSYDGEVSFLGPMAKLGFVTGEEGFPESFTETFTYIGQTIMNLPSSYTWSTDKTTQRSTILFNGTAPDGVCPSSMVPSPTPAPTKVAKRGKGGRRLPSLP